MVNGLTGLAVIYRCKPSSVKPSRSSSIWEKVLGDVRVAGTLSTLAKLYSAEGKHADAEAALKRSIAIRERAAGSRSLDLAEDLGVYASLLRKIYRDSDAVALKVRCRHPDRAARA